MFVDGQPAQPNGEGAFRIDVGPGLHRVQIENTLQGNEWRFMPSWNQARAGHARLPAGHDRSGPHRAIADGCAAIVGMATTVLTIAFVLAWIVSALRAWGDVTDAGVGGSGIALARLPGAPARQ